ncbi:extracellular solute-binding protein [Sphingomonas qomolangmaensis]|uniref:Thiaminase-1 insert domain-containing protein n=1 Tax=Sphingomonas qomolangmaensis TaxID=2918765 RepID=A0ABY5L816_9SPHN|nr:extracellular solute-binding protein [Sphingomonas qomolangmaensis]UUL82582.1 hypothetical protein NMP03_15650 [Sphingomonas qomolangmaensis]
MRTLLLAASLVVATISDAPSIAQDSAAPPRRVLKASLYPYIPDASTAYWAIEQEFEARHPQIDLQITLKSGYYDERPAKEGIVHENADVYELDSVFLDDFVQAGRIAPLTGFGDVVEQLLPFSREIVTKDGKLLGLPHWVCGNFLFYREGDKAIEDAKSLGDIERALRSQPDQWLIADFSGKSTLGEIYLDGAMDQFATRDAALRRVDPNRLDPGVVGMMTRAIALFRPGFGRDGDYHDRAGFYAGQFARGAGRAYVGYSEQLFFAMSESMLSCRKDEGCLDPKTIKVAEWPLADRGSQPIAWVDILVIQARLAPAKRADAEAFLRFMTAPDTYKMLLMPRWDAPPRYLLPAREDVFADPDLVEAAPLYPIFRARIDRAIPITDKKLNQRLRDIGERLDATLPTR